MIQILGLLGMYFDAVVVEVETFLLLFRLDLAILCSKIESSELERCNIFSDIGQLISKANFLVLI